MKKHFLPYIALLLFTLCPPTDSSAQLLEDPLDSEVSPAETTAWNSDWTAFVTAAQGKADEAQAKLKPIKERYEELKSKGRVTAQEKDEMRSLAREAAKVQTDYYQFRLTRLEQLKGQYGQHQGPAAEIEKEMKSANDQLAAVAANLERRLKEIDAMKEDSPGIEILGEEMAQ